MGQSSSKRPPLLFSVDGYNIYMSGTEMICLTNRDRIIQQFYKDYQIIGNKKILTKYSVSTAGTQIDFMFVENTCFVEIKDLRQNRSYFCLVEKDSTQIEKYYREFHCITENYCEPTLTDLILPKRNRNTYNIFTQRPSHEITDYIWVLDEYKKITL